MNAPSRTPARTECRWLVAVLLFTAAVAAAGAIYFVWRVMAAGAGC